MPINKSTHSPEGELLVHSPVPHEERITRRAGELWSLSDEEIAKTLQEEMPDALTLLYGSRPLTEHDRRLELCQQIWRATSQRRWLNFHNQVVGLLFPFDYGENKHKLITKFIDEQESLGAFTAAYPARANLEYFCIYFLLEARAILHNSISTPRFRAEYYKNESPETRSRAVRGEIYTLLLPVRTEQFKPYLEAELKAMEDAGIFSEQYPKGASPEQAAYRILEAMYKVQKQKEERQARWESKLAKAKKEFERDEEFLEHQATRPRRKGEHRASFEKETGRKA